MPLAGGPCQAGQHTPLAAERQEPVHVPVFITFLRIQPCCRIGLAKGLTGAAHAAPCHASSRTTSISLHLRLFVDLSGVGVKQEHASRWGKNRWRAQLLPTSYQRYAQPCNQIVSLQAQQLGSERISLYAYSSTNLAGRCPASSLQASLGAHPATYVNSKMCFRWSSFFFPGRSCQQAQFVLRHLVQRQQCWGGSNKTMDRFH
jgi:hypothetical protein